MADDWQVGDLALCVANSLPGSEPTKKLKIGAIYTVTSVRWSFGSQCIALGVAGVRTRNRWGDWHGFLFRKIKPLTDEEREDFEEDLRVPGHDLLPHTPQAPARAAVNLPASSSSQSLRDEAGLSIQRTVHG